MLTVAMIREARDALIAAQCETETFHLYVSPAKAAESGYVDGQVLAFDDGSPVIVHVDDQVPAHLDGVATPWEYGLHRVSEMDRIIMAKMFGDEP